MHSPRASNFIGIGHADVGATVIGKIQVIVAQRILYPFRHLDQRGPLDIAAHSRIHLRRDDRAIAKAGGSNVGWLCRLRR